MENNKYIVTLQEFGGIDGLSMIYDLDLYDDLKGVRPQVVEERDELIPLGFDNLALSMELPDIAEHIKNGDGLVLYNIGNLVDEENSIDPLFLGSHPNQSMQTQGRDAKNMADTSGYLGRGIDRLYSGVENWLIPPSISSKGGGDILMGKNRPMNLGLHLSTVHFNRVNSRGIIGINRTGEIKGESENFKYDLFEKAWTKEIETIDIVNEITDPIGETTFPLPDRLKSVIQIIENAENYEHSKGAVIGSTLSVPNSWDMHGTTYDNMHGENGNLKAVNDTLHNLIKELKLRGLWDKVTIMIHSEFGRTTHNNSALGTDHAWGSFTFVFGGDVDGNKMIGDKLEWMGPQFNETRNLIPTISYDQCFASMFRWLGLSMSDTIDCLLSPEGSFDRTLSIYGISERLVSGEEPEEPILNYKIYGKDKYLNNGDIITYNDITLILEENTDIVKYTLNGNDVNTGNDLIHDLELNDGINIINVKDKDGNVGEEFRLTVEEQEEPILEYKIYGKDKYLNDGDAIDYDEVILMLEEGTDVTKYTLNGNDVNTGNDLTHDLELNEGINIINVKDEDGNVGEEFRLTVKEEEELEENITPKAVITGSREGIVGETLTFSGEESIDSDGNIEEYIWFLDGQEVGRGELLNLILDEENTHILTLKVMDNNGGSNKKELTVTVLSSISETLAVIKGLVYGEKGESIEFDGIMSETSHGDIIDYIWEIDGEEYTGSKVYHTFTLSKEYQIKLRVVDSEGGENTSSLNIKIGDELTPNLDYKVYGVDGDLVDGDIIDYKEVTLILEVGTDVTKYTLNGNDVNTGNDLTHYLELNEGTNRINVKDKDGNTGEELRLTVEEPEEPVLDYKIYGKDKYLNNGDIIDYEEVILMLEVGTDATKYTLNGNTFNIDGELTTYLNLREGTNRINVKDKDGNTGEEFKLIVEKETPELPEDIEKIADKAVAVWRGEAGNNMLSKTNVYIWGSNGINSNRVSYLEFDISAIKNNGYNQIKLALYIKGKAGVELNFYGSETYNNWKENTITWNNSSYHDKDYSIIEISDDVVHVLDHEFGQDMEVHRYVEFDVTDYLKGVSSDKVTFIITNNRRDGEQGVHFKPLRNNGNQPKLRFKNI